MIDNRIKVLFLKRVRVYSVFLSEFVHALLFFEPRTLSVVAKSNEVSLQ